MLKITIIAVGKLKERYWREAVDEYLKRLKPYVRVDVIEVPDAPDSLGENEARTREGEGIVRALPDGAHVVLLDIVGKQRSSEGLAQHIDNLAVQGVSHIAFVIGGSHGASERVRSAVKETLSFGAITLPHNLARVVLVEQLYRVCRISRNEPYHK